MRIINANRKLPLALLLVVAHAASAQDSSADERADQLFHDAANLQNAREFDLAAETWLKLRAVGDAPPRLAEEGAFQLGNCYLQTKQFDKTAEAFDSFIANYAKSRRVAEAYYKLGGVHDSMVWAGKKESYPKAVAAFQRIRESRFPGKPTAEVIDSVAKLVARVKMPRGAFQRRLERHQVGYRLPQRTEDAIEAGLAFIARQQQPDGRWQLKLGGASADKNAPVMASDTAATGLALLAFQGGGYTHLEGKYKEQIKRGLDWLLQRQKDDGDLYVPTDDQSNMVSCSTVTQSQALLSARPTE